MTTETLRPDGDTYKNWSRSAGSDNFALIDEAVKDDADYIYATGTYSANGVSLAAPTGIQAGDTIISVTIYAVAKYVSAAQGLYLGYNKGGGAQWASAKTLTGSYAEYSSVFTGFSVSDITNLELYLMSGDGAGAAYVCQAWAVVEYGSGCPKQMMYRMQVMST